LSELPGVVTAHVEGGAVVGERDARGRVGGDVLQFLPEQVAKVSEPTGAKYHSTEASKFSGLGRLQIGIADRDVAADVVGRHC
jgi:hypothetical protein